MHLSSSRSTAFKTSSRCSEFPNISYNNVISFVFLLPSNFRRDYDYGCVSLVGPPPHGVRELARRCCASSGQLVWNVVRNTSNAFWHLSKCASRYLRHSDLMSGRSVSELGVLQAVVQSEEKEDRRGVRNSCRASLAKSTVRGLVKPEMQRCRTMQEHRGHRDQYREMADCIRLPKVDDCCCENCAQAQNSQPEQCKAS